MTKTIRWIARIWSAFLIAYVLLMLIGITVSLVTTGTADPNAEEDYPFIENLPPIFMFIAIFGLGIAWKWEKVGGSINLIFCSGILPLLLIFWPLSEFRFVIPYIMLFIVAIPGMLFLVCWWRTR